MIFKSDEEIIAKAQAMAEDFAKLRCKQLFSQFLNESRLIDDLYKAHQLTAKDKAMDELKFIQFFIDDFHLNFGHVIALAYAMGHVDCAQNIRLGTYKEAPKAPSPEKPVQLVTPGSND